MSKKEYMSARAFLLNNNCKQLFELEKSVSKILANGLLKVASNIKRDFDQASKLQPYWEIYAPLQRGHQPSGRAFPWGEVGEKVIEGYLYSNAAQLFGEVKFIGIPFGHDIRFATNKAFIQIDAKSTGPSDNINQIVSSPNQITGDGLLDSSSRVVNKKFKAVGLNKCHDFRPELPPFYIIDGRILPTLTFYVKVVYSVANLGNQPLEYLELICVPNGLIMFDGPNLSQTTKGLFTPGKDEAKVVRKRVRINLYPLSGTQGWRCQKIKFDKTEPYIELRKP